VFLLLPGSMVGRVLGVGEASQRFSTG